jgi:hypothetical protein
MPWYYRVRNAINAATPFLAPTQKTNLSLLVSAILKKRTLCLSELARVYPTPKEKNAGWTPPSTACCTASKGSGVSPTTSGSTPWGCSSLSCPTSSPL